MIKLDEHYYLTNDSNQWVLNFEKEGEINPKTGKPTIKKDTWYCGTIQGCIRRYYNESTKDCSNLQELKESIDKIESKLDELKLGV